MIQKNLIPDGNNQLIVITDGAFQPSDQASIEKLVRKYTRKGFRTSVVAIESNDFAKQKLKLVSEAGNGSFLLIDSMSDASARLIEEIKKQSAR